MPVTMDLRKNKDVKPEPEPVLVEEAAPEPTLAVDRPHPENASQCEGEFNAKDVLYPYISAVSQSSECVSDHPEYIGKLLLGKEHCLGASVPVIVTRIEKHYEEVVEFGAGIIPTRWKTMADAEAAGVEFLEVGTIDLLIEVPPKASEGLANQALLEADGKGYVGARMTVRKKGYKQTIGVLVRDLNAWLKGKFVNGRYLLETERASWQGKVWYIVKLKAAGPTSEGLRAALSIQFGL